MPEKYPVQTTNALEKIESGELEAWEESPTDRNQVLIKLLMPGIRLEHSADDYFSALVSIRSDLERRGFMLINYGSSLKVYPSPMSRSMGSGEKAYRLSLGEQAKTENLVSIFETGPDVEPSTVAEQEAFYTSWLASLRKRAP